MPEQLTFLQPPPPAEAVPAWETLQPEQQYPQALCTAEPEALLDLAEDLEAVWSAPSTSDRDRKELLRTLLEEVLVTHD